MSEQVEASALDRAVEAMARGGLPEAFPAPLAPAATKGGLEIVIEEGDWPDEDIEWAERVMRAALQAADDLLREHYWAEFRERLLGEETITIELTRESGQALLDGVEFSLGYGVSGDLASEAADAIHAALATTQHKGGSQ